MDHAAALERARTEGELVWHYTTLDTLALILQGNFLLATEVSFQNDIRETLTADAAFKEALEALQADPTYELFARQALRFLGDEPHWDPWSDLPSRQLVHDARFILCASDDPDSLYAWRTYSSGGIGCSIGLDPKVALGIADPDSNPSPRRIRHWRQVVYLPGRVRQAAERSLKRLGDLWNTAYARDAVEEGHDEAFGLIIAHLAEARADVRSRAKDPAFSDEHEQRVTVEAFSRKALLTTPSSMGPRPTSASSPARPASGVPRSKKRHWRRSCPSARFGWVPTRRRVRHQQCSGCSSRTTTRSTPGTSMTTQRRNACSRRGRTRSCSLALSTRTGHDDRLRDVQKRGPPMIRLADFLPVPEPASTKLKFNMRAGNGGGEAWDFLVDDHPEWLNLSRWRAVNANNNMGHARYLLAWAQYYPYGPNYFIFGGFFRVTPVVPAVIDGYGYDLELQELHAKYIKRLIIKLDKPLGRQVYLRRYETVQEQLAPEVYELAPDTKLGTFPGYQNVRLRHHELQRIVANDEPSWKDALSIVKGVYVITDLSDGRLYVGSASGEANGLWQRWSGYAQLSNLTGGNRELENIRRELGDAHILGNFQYSILEIFDPKTKAETILSRESFWKQALHSRRPHGLNAN